MSTFLAISSILYSVVNHALHFISRVYLFCIAETLYPLTIISFPPNPQSLASCFWTSKGKELLNGVLFTDGTSAGGTLKINLALILYIVHEPHHRWLFFFFPYQKFGSLLTVLSLSIYTFCLSLP